MHLVFLERERDLILPLKQAAAALSTPCDGRRSTQGLARRHAHLPRVYLHMILLDQIFRFFVHYEPSCDGVGACLGRCKIFVLGLVLPFSP